MRWCTAVGAWGDSFVAMGNARAAMAARGERTFGLIHYGFDSNISAFLRHQEGVFDVRHVKPENPAAYRYWLSRMSDPTIPLIEYAGEMLRGTALNVRDCQRTQVYNLNIRQPVHRWHEPILPSGATAWAKSFVKSTCGDRPFAMLHPFSTQSSALEGHWPWWKSAIEWLADIAPEFGVKIVWTGAVNPLEIRSPHIVNAVGLTPSMCEVFALQRLAALTVCTSNGCAHWAVMDNSPAVVCCNNHMLPEDRHIFKEWISAPPVVQVEYRDKLDVFQARVCEALSGRVL
jgi:hypothetical protein